MDAINLIHPSTFQQPKTRTMEIGITNPAPDTEKQVAIYETKEERENRICSDNMEKDLALKDPILHTPQEERVVASRRRA